MRDRCYQEDYRQLDGAELHKAAQNRRYRDAVDWARYMRYWRKRDSFRTEARERKRAREYYKRHRKQVLAKRHRQRAAQKASRGACSH